MTAPESMSPHNQIVGLFPELLGIGGVQEAGRLTAAALSETARRRGSSVDFLSLNDPPGPHSLGVAGQAITFRSFGRAKMSFVLSAIGRVRRTAKDSTPIILAGHPNLAVPAGWMQRASSRAKTVVMAHGMEVWQPLPSFRRRALLRADLVLGPSCDTVQKLIEVQGVAPEKVRRLAWPLSSGFLRMADAPAVLPVPRGFPQSGPVILTVGRWASSERYKGADELIRAIPQLQAAVPGLQLVAVGGGDDLPRLRELATGLGIAAAACTSLENLSREEVAACLFARGSLRIAQRWRGFRIGLSRGDGFLESGGRSGLWRHNRRVVEDGVNGLLIPPHDASALIHALLPIAQRRTVPHATGKARSRNRPAKNISSTRLSGRTGNDSRQSKPSGNRIDSAVHILKVVQAYYPFQEHGGPVVKVRALARGLVQRGHHVTVLTADLGLREAQRDRNEDRALQMGLACSQQDGVDAIYLSTLAHCRALTINLACDRIPCRAATRGFDVVHFYGLYDLLGPAVSSSCRRLEIPYVIEPMGMFRPIVRNLWLKRMYHRVPGKSFIAGARFLVATSDQERQESDRRRDRAFSDCRPPEWSRGPRELARTGRFSPSMGHSPGRKGHPLFWGKLVSKKSPELSFDRGLCPMARQVRSRCGFCVNFGRPRGSGWFPSST